MCVMRGAGGGARVGVEARAGAVRVCVCVAGAGPGGGPHTGAGGQCPPTALLADIRHSRATAVPRARFGSSVCAR